jgi:hypothetical protein
LPDHDHGAVDLDVATPNVLVIIVVIVVIVDGLDRLLDGDLGALTAREPRPPPELAAVRDAMAALTAASSIGVSGEGVGDRHVPVV